MSEQVDYRELERLVVAQPQVHAADYYINARPRTQVVYDQTIQMGKSILEERDTVQLSPQTMVDMAVQSINNAIKALKGSAEQSNGAITTPATSSAPVQQPVNPQQNSPAAFAKATVQSPMNAATQASRQPAGQEAGSVQATTAEEVQANRPKTVTVTPASSTVEPAQPDSVASTSAAANGDSLFLAGSATTDQSTGPVDQSAAVTSPAASAQPMAQQAPTPAATAQSTPATQPTPSGQPLPVDQPTAPDAGSAVDLPRSSVTVNSTQQDPDTPERPSVGKAIWRGLQWTLGFKRNNLE